MPGPTPQNNIERLFAAVIGTCALVMVASIIGMLSSTVGGDSTETDRPEVRRRVQRFRLRWQAPLVQLPK